MTSITADLRLSLPIKWAADGTPLMWAYHTPISRDIFQSNWRVLSATKFALFERGTTFAAEEGPQLASLAFADAAAEDARKYGTVDAGKAFLADLKRLTMVLVPTPQGNQTVMVDAAIARGAITADDWADAESALVFFTSAYATAPRRSAAIMADALALTLMGSITSLSLTAWADSFPSSTTAEHQQHPPLSARAMANAIPQ